MFLRKQRLHATCPRCQFQEEDTTHVLQCQNEYIVQLRQNILAELKVWLNSVDTDPDITLFIISGLSSWLADTPSSDNDTAVEPKLLHAIKSQLLLGWEVFLHGFIAKGLIECQQDYYSDMDSRKTGTRWGIQLISKLWNVIHQPWMHRNEVLHETEAIDQLSGIEILKEAITYEYNTGLDSLPYVYTPYFTEPLPVILLKSTTYLKRWFLIIRSGREDSCSYPRLDKFYTETCLRSWVGLKKK